MTHFHLITYRIAADGNARLCRICPIPNKHGFSDHLKANNQTWARIFSSPRLKGIGQGQQVLESLLQARNRLETFWS